MWKPYAKYRVGSSLFLENCKDIDYLYVYERYEDYIKAIKMYSHKYQADEHCKLKSDLETKLYVYSYCHHFWELIEGQAVKPYSIYKHKKEYAQLLIDYSKTIRNPKHWYYIYLGYCALKNGSGKKFTKAQISVAQDIHDKKEISDATKQELFDFLTNLVNN